MMKRILIVVTGMLCFTVASSSFAAVHLEKQPPLAKGIPETSNENFAVRKAALVQHVKDTIFRLSIEKSCVQAASTAMALDACEHGAPVATGNAGKVLQEVAPPVASKPVVAPVASTPQKTPAKK